MLVKLQSVDSYGVLIQTPSNQDLYGLDQAAQSADGYYGNGYHGDQMEHAQRQTFQPFESMTRTASQANDITMEMIVKRLKDR